MAQKKHPWKISLYCTNIQKEAIKRNSEELEEVYGISRNEILREILTKQIMTPEFLIKNGFIEPNMYDHYMRKRVARVKRISQEFKEQFSK
jgi:hypothetical protein